jgi:hypothetical protein
MTYTEEDELYKLAAPNQPEPEDDSDVADEDYEDAPDDESDSDSDEEYSDDGGEPDYERVDDTEEYDA